ncbi:helix-turn-helix transcriptional regulator [Nocardia beijingensis]|uniref:helix-turn-helix transcriptional regulator n=1 Tax=Nocardia beijingensis TaxID=95162 RepID=UPI0033CFBB12
MVGLRALRTGSGYWTAATWTKIEQGDYDPRLETLRKFAVVLKVRTSQLPDGWVGMQQAELRLPGTRAFLDLFNARTEPAGYRTGLMP